MATLMSAAVAAAPALPPQLVPPQLVPNTYALLRGCQTGCLFDVNTLHGYRTEIHPPNAVAFTRREPVIFPGDQAPSLTNKTYIYNCAPPPPVHK
jgi:hypothetical protein